jgi:hypothetical protein
MRYIIRHQFRDLGNYYGSHFFKGLYNSLNQLYPNHTFEIQNDSSYENRGYGSIYSCMNFSIVNPENNKYILVSFFDNWKYHFMKHLGWEPNKMTQFFYPGGFNYIDYFHFKENQSYNNDIECPSNIDKIYRSFFYSSYEIESTENPTSEIFKYRDITSTLNQLYFRGYMWDFRKDMISHLSHPEINIIDKNQENKNLNYNQYLKDLSNYRCALSLPGGTEVCNRDIECFAVGVPVIRPFLNIQYPDPIVPNFHYISCYHDCKYWDGNPYYLSYNDFAQYLLDYWDRVKNNFEFLSFISQNARNWFAKNCTLDNNLSYVLSQINIGGLNG